MTLPPPPALLAGALLLGWPLIHLASVLAAMRPRAQMRALAADLKSDLSDDPDALRTIDRAVSDSHGHAAFAVFPIIIPVAILAMSILELFGRERPSLGDTPEKRARRDRQQKKLRRDILAMDYVLQENGRLVEETRYYESYSYKKLIKDERYQEILSLSFQISLIRWPVVAFLTVLNSVPFLPLFGIAYGLREAASVIPHLARRFSSNLRILHQSI